MYTYLSWMLILLVNKTLVSCDQAVTLWMLRNYIIVTPNETQWATERLVWSRLGLVGERRRHGT
jgi:hypothetical protein